MRRLVPLALVLVLAGCDAMDDRALQESGFEPAKIPAVPCSTAGPRVDGKADEFGDYKNANPATYGITAAPTVPVRPAADWEGAQGLLLAYPASLGKAGNEILTDITKSAAQTGNVYVVAPSVSDQTNYVTQLKNAGMAQATIDAKVHFIQKKLDTQWAGAFGPVYLLYDGKIGFADPRYQWDRIYDDAIPTALGSLWGVTVYRVPLDMEASGILADSQGHCCLTQAFYWANATAKLNVDKYLHDYLGCQAMTVLSPIDEPSGHVTFFAKLVADGAVLLGSYSATQDPAAKDILDQDEMILKAAGFTVHRIPMPGHADGVWRTYTASVTLNGQNFWPIYGTDKDIEADALAVWQSAAPAWNHVGINIDKLAEWGGTLRDLAQAMPSGNLLPLEASPQVICDDVTCFPGACEPDCSGKQCGDDGCGGSCGDCTGIQEVCEAGLCVCKAACQGKQCGDDGCGGSCGDCTGVQETCEAGLCVCQATCQGKQCGGDGCGGSCGDCGEGSSCDPAGQCVPDGGEDVVEAPDTAVGPDLGPGPDTEPPADLLTPDSGLADAAPESTSPEDGGAGTNSEPGIETRAADPGEEPNDVPPVADMVSGTDASPTQDVVSGGDSQAGTDISPVIDTGKSGGGCSTAGASSPAAPLLLCGLLMALQARRTRRTGGQT
jgi:agmatine/peptidylarginine deiminase